MSNLFRAMASGAVASLAVAVMALTGIAQENTGQVQQPLVNGTLVGPPLQEQYGLLAIVSAQPSGGTTSCSASLLTNDWAITAAHCLTAANLITPSTVTVTANWKKIQQRKAAQIESFGSSPNWEPWDIALIRMDARFVVAGSSDGFKQIVWGDGPFSNLEKTPIEIFGRGINQFARGSGAGATPSQSDGQYRYGKAVIRRIEKSRYWYPSQNGQMIAGGDSGGPTFVTLKLGRALTGVHSRCKTQCLTDQTCQPGSWMWVSATSECGDAPVQPLWNQISQIISTTRSPDSIPFPGTFGTTPANFRPVFVYAIANNGDLLWYRQDSNDSKWMGPRKVGNGWESFKDVIPAGGNNFYALTEDGALEWYQHDGVNDGSLNWKGPVDVGSGWAFAKIFSGSDGVVYAIKDDGSLVWYRHEGFRHGGGIDTWSGPKVVGSGWGQFKDVFSIGQGIIYAVKPDGQLLWYRHDGFTTGDAKWSGPLTVGTGWQNFRAIVPVGDGIILAINDDGKLLWYKHIDYLAGATRALTPAEMAARMAAGGDTSNAAQWEGPVEIGSGWQGFRKVIALLPSTPVEPR